MKHRSPAYWPTRILLVVGIASVAAIGLGLLAPIIPEGFSDPRPSVILGPLEISVGVGVVWFVVPVVGLIWMVRVFRGLREDEPPPWRYRNR